MEQIYLGINPYDENAGMKFAGRSKETWELYDRISRNDYTVYYAASGEGKSSLIRAGLLPILRRRDFFPVYIVFEDKEFADVASIETVIENRIKIEANKHNVIYEQSKWSENHFTPEQSEKLKNNLWWKIRNYCFKRGDTELKPLFIFDQFEEVFTKAAYKWTDSFFRWLEEISTDYPPVALREDEELRRVDLPTRKNFKALFSFRTEYLGDLDYWCVQKHFLPSLQENRMCLKPLTPKGAREIINLNKASLGKYANEIVQGCALPNASIDVDEQPCVYALILSVVCQTLSDLNDNEREALLVRLNENQDEAIDDVLLEFYRKKLKDAGLDYIKDEKIIAAIEDALVDENGKRSRRDMDESVMRSIAKWIDRLSQKDNGLVKIIGSKEINCVTINTVEFPHDRLCKSIDTARKERQGRIEWQLNRQSEWTQFSVITAIICIIAYLWNSMMPAIKPVIHNIINFPNENVFVWLDAAFKALKKYLEIPYDNSIDMNSIDMGCSTIILMAMLLVFVPLLTVFIMRKDKKWYIVSSITSFISSFGLGYLIYRNNDIEFEDNYVPLITIIVFCASIFVFIISGLRLKKSFDFKSAMPSGEIKPSLWPLWGGFFIFSIYAFYEFLFRTTFGINEPCDSAWALFVLPMLYIFWTMGFFCMKIDNKNKNKILWGYSIIIVVILSLLWRVSYIPYHNTFKQEYGFLSSTILIVLFIASSIAILSMTVSNSRYYILSISKRVAVATGGLVIMFITFFLNLGYNPIVIAPHSVRHVSSWRDVVIQNSDSLFGIVYSTNCDTIIPCCIHLPEERIDRTLANGCAIIERKSLSSIFLESSENANNDNSLVWNHTNKMITATIPVVPTLEEYLQKTKRRGLPYGGSLKDSIDYYAAKLFVETREANIKFILNSAKYDLKALKSLTVLDSLQNIALDKELKKISLKDTLKNSVVRDRMAILEDKLLVDFYCELSRSYLLCLIKDRANHLDMPAMFTLTRTYLLAYFAEVPSMDIKYKFTNNVAMKLNDELYNDSDTTIICSADILNQKLFAWYNIFNSLCLMDIKWNSKTFEDNVNSNNNLNHLEEIKEIQQGITNELLSISYTLKNVKNILGGDISDASLIDNLKKYLETTNSKRYEDILERLDKISYALDIVNTVEADKSFNRLKINVLDSCLFKIMKGHDTNIYNNAFENVCKNFITVSILRCYNTDNCIKDYSDYIKKKDGLYYSIIKIDRLNKDAKKNRTKLDSLSNVSKQRLESIINTLRKQKK